MTVEDSRVHGTELFSIVVADKKVKNVPGFYKLVKTLTEDSVFVIDPGSTLGEARNGVRKVASLDEKESYKLVKDIGFTTFSEEGGVAIIHDPVKTLVFSSLLFSPEYIEKKFPKLFKKRKLISDAKEVAEKLSDLFGKNAFNVLSTKISNIEYYTVTNTLVVNLGKVLEIRLIPRLKGGVMVDVLKKKG